MSGIWSSIRDFSLGTMESGLEALHALIEPLAGVNAWGWAIIALTLIIRVLLLPLAIKQIRSMRAMQAIQPKLKEIQKKYKVDRELMKKDPEQYRAKRAKLNEEMMALYQREGVNPAASCLPLLAQAPIFIALFWVLRDSDDIRQQPFYFFTDFISADSTAQGLGALVSASGWPGIMLILLMVVTMFVMQKQMMARQASSGADNPMAQQQKIMLYVLPVFLGVISWNLPLGVLLYWVTTNAWQGAQQGIMLREVKHEVEEGTLGEHRGGEAATRKGTTTKGKGGSDGRAANKKGDEPSKGASSGPSSRSGSGASSGEKPTTKKPSSSGKGAPKSGQGGSKPGKGGAPSNNGGSSRNGAASNGSRRRADHLPRRPNRG